MIQSTPPMEDQLILIFSLLFMLSLVSERLANFLKLQLHEKKFIGLSFGNLRLKGEHKDKEKHREKAVLIINIFSGFIIAASLNVDLIQVINNLGTIDKNIGWERTDYFKWYTIFGWVFTAIFLSLGSKFWHDLLGIVWAIKDTKKKIGDSSSSAAKHSTDLPESEQEDILKRAIARDSKKWKHQYSGIKSVAIGRNVTSGKTDTTGLTLRFGVNKKNEDVTSVIPQYIPFENYKIPTDVYTAGGFQFNSLKPGDHIYRRKRGSGDEEKGTCSIRVQRKIDDNTFKHFFISCYHVIYNRELFVNGIKESAGTPQNPDVFDMKGTLIGKAEEGMMNTFIDAALVEITSPDNMESHPDIKSNEIVQLGSGNLETKVIVITPGGKKDSKIKLVSTEHEVNELNFRNEFEELIAIEKVTSPGDSGSAVITADGKLVGIVIGSDKQHTLIQNFQYVVNNLRVSPNN
ncbi:hypothetical protein [Reichenbachiella sp.]|uniref:hypothetical protein n=1 Tax=Reichenbachiella sp. TaxID=2184521 RepID=UPI003BAE5189